MDTGVTSVLSDLAINTVLLLLFVPCHYSIVTLTYSVKLPSVHVEDVECGVQAGIFSVQ